MQCIMLGYTHNGYKLWNVEKQRVVTGRNVVFNEHHFQFRESFQTATESTGGSRSDIIPNQSSGCFDNETISVGSVLDTTVTREGFPRESYPYTSSTNFPGARNSEEHDSVQVDRGINESNGFSTEHVHIEESQDVSTPTRKSCRFKWRPHYLDNYVLLAKVARVTDKINEAHLSKHEASNFDLNAFELSDPIKHFEQEGRIVLNAVNFCDEVPLDFQDLQNRRTGIFGMLRMHS